MRKTWKSLAFTLLGGALLACAGAMPAAAQLDGIRCAGWPGAPGVPGLIVVRPGATCNGALFTGAQKHPLVSLKVVEPPSQGRFTLVGLRNFTYAAPANVSGRDAVVLEGEWQNGGGTFHRRRRLRIVSEAEYYASGGTQGGPGSGLKTSRPGSRGAAGRR